jgi:hypothetical protein
MESSLRDYHKGIRYRTSPYQVLLQRDHKLPVLDAHNRKVYLAWSIPMALTVLELTNLKANPARADKIAIFKWAAYLIAGVYSTYLVKDTVKHLDYYNRIYHRPPQIQIAAIQNAELYKLHARR